jgi:ABC-type transport system involved in cytochrome bd biosynthesis fused ATPase/permease subunit
MEEDHEVYVDAAETQHEQGDSGQVTNGACNSKLESSAAVASTGSDGLGMDVDENMESKDISLSDDDIVIALMGVTGSGKSTFISLLAEQSVRIGHSLNSCMTPVKKKEWPSQATTDKNSPYSHRHRRHWDIQLPVRRADGLPY